MLLSVCLNIGYISITLAVSLRTSMKLVFTKAIESIFITAGYLMSNIGSYFLCLFNVFCVFVLFEVSAKLLKASISFFMSIHLPASLSVCLSVRKK